MAEASGWQTGVHPSKTAPKTRMDLSGGPAVASQMHYTTTTTTTNSSSSSSNRMVSTYQRAHGREEAAVERRQSNTPLAITDAGVGLHPIGARLPGLKCPPAGEEDDLGLGGAGDKRHVRLWISVGHRDRYGRCCAVEVVDGDHRPLREALQEP